MILGACAILVGIGAVTMMLVISQAGRSPVTGKMETAYWTGFIIVSVGIIGALLVLALEV
jgi:hypothetical protein